MERSEAVPVSRPKSWELLFPICGTVTVRSWGPHCHQHNCPAGDTSWRSSEPIWSRKGVQLSPTFQPSPGRNQASTASLNFCFFWSSFTLLTSNCLEGIRSWKPFSCKQEMGYGKAFLARRAPESPLFQKCPTGSHQTTIPLCLTHLTKLNPDHHYAPRPSVPCCYCILFFFF